MSLFEITKHGRVNRFEVTGASGSSVDVTRRTLEGGRVIARHAQRYASGDFGEVRGYNPMLTTTQVISLRDWIASESVERA